MPATKEKDKTDNDGNATPAKAPSILDDMETEDEMLIPLRGRNYDPEVVAIREQLEACQRDGKARSFKNVTKEKREDYARKVRSAAEMTGRETIKVSTRYDEYNQKLYWGPKDVLDKLANKKAS